MNLLAQSYIYYKRSTVIFDVLPTDITNLKSKCKKPLLPIITGEIKLGNIINSNNFIDQ